MRDLFPGHFKQSEESLKKVWDACIFVFDANILLNFYRYSDSAKSEFLQLLQKIKDRVWIPHRAAEEYLSNRLSVIDQQERSYDDTVKAIRSLQNNLENARQHPFVNQKTMKKVELVFSLLYDELAENKSVHTKRITDDEIKEAISTIFSDNVGKPYSKEKLEKIISDGEERYRQKTPPGFKDGGKSSGNEVFSEQCRKYGDLIVWNQVIDKAIASKKPIILVTDDKKEDWWEKFKGKTVGPRPELVEEFKEKSENSFYMYQADRFLELARENLNEKVSDEIVQEIREVRRRDSLANKKIMEMEYVKHRKLNIQHGMKELDHLRTQIMAQEHEINVLQGKRYMLESEREVLKEYRSHIFHENGRDFEADRVDKNYKLVSEEYEQVRKNLEMSKVKYNKLQHKIMLLEQELEHGIRVIE